MTFGVGFCTFHPRWPPPAPERTLPTESTTLRITHSLLTCFLCLVLGLDVAQGAVVCFDARGHLAIELGHCSDTSEDVACQEARGSCAGAITSCCREAEGDCVNVSISEEGLGRRSLDELSSRASVPSVAGHLPFDPSHLLAPRKTCARARLEGHSAPATLRSLRSIVLLI